MHVGSARRMGFGGDGEVMKCGRDLKLFMCGKLPLAGGDAKCEVIGAARAFVWSMHTFFWLQSAQTIARLRLGQRRRTST